MMEGTVGRPSKYSVEIADKICALLAEGQSLSKICRSDDMPSTVTVYAWLRKEVEFLNNYARARADQSDHYADEIIDIADDVASDPYEIQKAKLRIDSRKWMAGQMKPKRYGAKPEGIEPEGEEELRSIKVIRKSARKNAGPE